MRNRSQVWEEFDSRAAKRNSEFVHNMHTVACEVIHLRSIFTLATTVVALHVAATVAQVVLCLLKMQQHYATDYSEAHLQSRLVCKIILSYTVRYCVFALCLCMLTLYTGIVPDVCISILCS